jgi:hypothetical protein
VEQGQQDEAVASAQRYLALALSRNDAGLDLYLEVITARTALLGNLRVAAGLRMQQVQRPADRGPGWRLASGTRRFLRNLGTRSVGMAG